MTIKRHDGRDCPVDPDTRVVVKYRGGHVSKAILASKRRWKAWPKGESDFDIVAYRLATKDDPEE